MSDISNWKILKRLKTDDLNLKKWTLTLEFEYGVNERLGPDARSGVSSSGCLLKVWETVQLWVKIILLSIYSRTKIASWNCLEVPSFTGTINSTWLKSICGYNTRGYIRIKSWFCPFIRASYQGIPWRVHNNLFGGNMNSNLQVRPTNCIIAIKILADTFYCAWL